MPLDEPHPRGKPAARAPDGGQIKLGVVAVVAGIAAIVGLGAAGVSGTAATPQSLSGTPSASASIAAGAWGKPAAGPVSSSFQTTRCLGGCRPHTGTDLSVPSGTPVYAASSGVVLDARCTSAFCDRPGYLGLGGYGNLLTLQHAGGVVTRYGHLSAFAVKPGDTVAAGQLVAYSGSTGNSTGPHLHFEVKVDGAFVDPEIWMRQHGATL